jgi:hypothetical protein
MDCRASPAMMADAFEPVSNPARPRTGRAGFFFANSCLLPTRAQNQESFAMSPTSRRLLLGLGLAGLMMECTVIQPALAADKVSLFKVITSKDEIVIGLPDDELAQLDGGNAGGIAKTLVAKGTMSVWQYAVRKAPTGDLEQAPLHKVGLIASDSLRVEPYASPLTVVPIEETKK